METVGWEVSEATAARMIRAGFAVRRPDGSLALSADGERWVRAYLRRLEYA